MNVITRSVSALGALILLFGSSAYAVVLTFDGNICSGGSICTNGSPIDQSYGDVPGQLDVVYDTDAFAGGSSNLLFWADNYSGMFNVAYGSPGGATAEVFLDVLPGFEVTLNSFDLGAWPNTNRSSQWTLLDPVASIIIGHQDGDYGFSKHWATTLCLSTFCAHQRKTAIRLLIVPRNHSYHRRNKESL